MGKLEERGSKPVQADELARAMRDHRVPLVFLEAYGEARKTFERLGEPGAVASAWHQIAMVHQEAGDYDAAEDAYRKSLKLKVERGDRSGEASTLNQLGNLARSRKQPEEAVRLLRQAAEILLLPERLD